MSQIASSGLHFMKSCQISYNHACANNKTLKNMVATDNKKSFFTDIKKGEFSTSHLSRKVHFYTTEPMKSVSFIVKRKIPPCNLADLVVVRLERLHYVINEWIHQPGP